MLQPTHQGRRNEQTGLIHDEAFMMGIRRYLKTLEVGKVSIHCDETGSYAQEHSGYA